MNNLYRRYKISLITNDDITIEEKEIIKFIINEVKHNFEFLLKYDTVYDIIWIKYYDFWEVLEKVYLLSDIIIKDVVKDVIENIYNIKLERTLLPLFNTDLAH
jgi:hypothetical protein